MPTYRLTLPLGLALFLIALAGCAPQSSTAGPKTQIAAMAPGTARVWFLRQPDPIGGNVEAARPMVFANGVPVSQIQEGTAFYHDLPPGPYRFTVQAYGTPSGQRDAIQLMPGTQTYLQIQWAANWREGSPVGGAAFAVNTMSPEIAQQYLPILTNLGPR
jgi:hypothetical protein